MLFQPKEIFYMENKINNHTSLNNKLIVILKEKKKNFFIYLSFSNYYFIRYKYF